jgi:hypothetical protein
MVPIIIALIPYFVPMIIIIIGYFYHLFTVHLPAEQRLYISGFADTAVQMVEQQFALSSNSEKKDHAMVMIRAMFKAFNLPIPPDAVLSAFIEAAVSALNKEVSVPPPAALLQAPKQA